MMLMFFIVEKMTAKEMKKEISERITPIKSFCEKMNITIRYEDNDLIADEVASQIQEIIEIFQLQEDETSRLRIKKFQQFQVNFELFLKSINQLSDLDKVLLYHGLFMNATQMELTEKAEILELLNVPCISQAKINRLYQDACLQLLDWIKYNEAKAIKYKPTTSLQLSHC